MLTTHTITDLPRTPVPIFSNSHMLLRGTDQGQWLAGKPEGKTGRPLEEEDEPVSGR